jgi:mediator of RNA polymerase II transcription subunit 13
MRKLLCVRLLPLRGRADNLQGDFEAVAYQALSITRITTPLPSKTRDTNTYENLRAVEAELRQGRQLVIQDASRPWLWLFRPITVDQVGQDTVELPEIDGYQLQRKTPSLFHS